MAKISKLEALQRTKSMLERDWNLPGEPLSTDDLRKKPPGGLGKSDAAIDAEVGSANNIDFADVNANVPVGGLIPAKTVGGMRDEIWKYIPKKNKK